MTKKNQNMIGCIIQARMGSSRLPGKTLIKLNQYRTTLDFVVNQLSFSALLDKIVIATTNLEQDDIIEKNACLQTTVLGEPQLGKRGLYPIHGASTSTPSSNQSLSLSTKESGKEVRTMMNMLSYCDGQNRFLVIAELIDEPFWEVEPLADRLIEQDLLQKVVRNQFEN